MILFRSLSHSLVVILLVIVAFNCLAQDVVPVSPAGQALVIGQVTSNPAKQYSRLFAMASYVTDQLQDLEIDGAEVKMTPSIEQMISLVNANKVQWVSETLYGASLLIDKAGMVPLLVRHKKRASMYKSLIITRKQNGINSLDDLVGRKLVFEDLESSSGYFIPRAELTNRGYKMMNLKNANGAVPPDAIGYFFSGSENSSVALLYMGKADAIAFSDQDWEKARAMTNPEKGEYKVIYQSEAYPRAIELVSSALAKSVQARMVEILLASPQDPKAFHVLDQYYSTTGFSPFQPHHQRALDRIKLFREQLGE